MRVAAGFLLLVLLVLLVVACQGEAVTVEVPADTPTPQPTYTPYPTLEPLPTYTPNPTLEPLPTHTPFPSLSPLPTLAPLPTLVPLATLVPLPTYTPYPTPTLAPTATPMLEPTPTSTPRPVPTRSPTATPRPTSTPRPTATPTPSRDEWESSGDWYRDTDYELRINEALRAQNIPGKARVATLDAIPTAWSADLSLSVGCINEIGIAYLTPYSWEVSPLVDTYAVGMWDDEEDEWIDDDLGWYREPLLTDDGSAIYISNQAQVRQIVRILEAANRNRNPDLVLNAGMFAADNDNVDALWAEYDPDGLEDALDYLGCH